MKKVTIQEIAQQMHLSRNTVAKALSDGAVSYETQINVLLTAQRLGYTKLTKEHLQKLQALQEQRGQTGTEALQTILVLFGKSQENFWTHIMAGISNELGRHGFRMLLHIVDEENPLSMGTNMILTPDVKGLIFLSVFPEAFVKKLAMSGLPMTFFDAPPNISDYLRYGDIIYSEGWFSVKQLLQRIIAMGRTSFGFIGYAGGTKSIGDRYSGYLSALSEAGLEAAPGFQFTERIPGDYYEYGEVEKLVQGMTEFPEVFVCANDAVAKCVICALHKQNCEAEKNIIFTGFDHTVEPEFFRQDIYSVDVHKEDVGKRLAKSVLDQSRDEMEHAIIAIRTYPDL